MQYNIGSLAPVLLGLAAGGAFVLQQSANAALRESLRSGAWAGFVSYLGGTLCMLVLAMLLREPLPDNATWLRSAGFDWAGGFFGAVYIAISILVVPRIGTATFLSLFIAGQMSLSLAIDHFGFLGLAPHAASAHRVVGALLVVAGATLMSGW